jgi:uncharacterized protein (TIGR00369 family)
MAAIGIRWGGRWEAVRTLLTMSEGPFWELIADGRDPSPTARLLGWELLAVDAAAGTIEVAFNATEQLLNPAGVIQGGMLAAMLDDTLGPALVATLEPGEWGPTTDLHVQFLAPVRPGRLVGRAHVYAAGGTPPRWRATWWTATVPSWPRPSRRQ